MTVRRPEISSYLQEAKEGGDITDNTAYDDAKLQQAQCEGRILTIQEILTYAKVIEDGTEADGAVRLGSRVTIARRRWQ